MSDPRHVKLANVLINYSLAVQPGEKLMIMGHAAALPIITEVHREALRANALVDYFIVVDALDEQMVRHGNEGQIAHMYDFMTTHFDHYDAHLRLWAEDNTRFLSKIDSKRVSKRSQALGGALGHMIERSAAGAVRWCVSRVPSLAYAQDAGMSLRDFEDFYFRAGLIDQADPVAGWLRVHDEQQRVIDFLSQHDEIHIVAPGTDITYHVGGRTWLNADGKVNFPDGEVFTAPIEDSTNGVVTYSYPALYQSMEVEDVRLTFRNGEVVEAKAKHGEDFLNELLDMDEGARYLGEVAFGLNYGIQQFSRSILFDEKIGGTMHMAVGKAYPQSGGTNQSALHWDMICDLREGRVYADGKLCYENGRFTI
jgi:aminopeptidase